MASSRGKKGERKHWKRVLAIVSPVITTKVNNKISVGSDLVRNPLPSGNQKTGI